MYGYVFELYTYMHLHSYTYNPHPQETAIMGDTQALGTMLTSEKEDS